MTVAVVVLAVAVVAAAGLFLLKPIEPEAFILEHVVPEDADALLWLDSLAPLAQSLAQLAARVPGTAGILDAGKLVLGVDLRDADAVARAGLRNDAGICVFRWHGALWLILPITSPEGGAHLSRLLQGRGYRVGPGLGAFEDLQNHWDIFDRQQDKVAIAHLFQSGAAAILRWQIAPRPADHASAEYTAWRKAAHMKEKALHGAQGQMHLRMAWQKEGPEIAALHTALGIGNLVFSGALDKIVRMEADFDMAAGKPTLRIELACQPGDLAEIAKFHQNFVVSTGPGLLDLGALLPDETPLFWRGRLNPAILNMLPSTLRDRFLPAALLSFWHPSLQGVDARSDLIAFLDGQVAAGLLGVADDFPLDPYLWTPATLRKGLRAFVAVSLQTDTQAAHFMDRVRSAIDTSSEKAVSVQMLEFSGFSVADPQGPWLMLRKDAQVVLVSGIGAQDDLQHIADGKFPSLQAAVRGELEKSAVHGAQLWTALLTSTPRIARSLRRRGVPDYVVQMLASVAAVATTVQWTQDGLQIRLALRPSELDADAGEAP